jgi:predicted  nucleic acid-binding Zn-ribbon protein
MISNSLNDSGVANFQNKSASSEAGLYKDLFNAYLRFFNKNSVNKDNFTEAANFFIKELGKKNDNLDNIQKELVSYDEEVRHLEMQLKNIEQQIKNAQSKPVAPAKKYGNFTKSKQTQVAQESPELQKLKQGKFELEAKLEAAQKLMQDKKDELYQKQNNELGALMNTSQEYSRSIRNSFAESVGSMESERREEAIQKYLKERFCESFWSVLSHSESEINQMLSKLTGTPTSNLADTRLGAVYYLVMAKNHKGMLPEIFLLALDSVNALEDLSDFYLAQTNISKTDEVVQDFYKNLQTLKELAQAMANVSSSHYKQVVDDNGKINIAFANQFCTLERKSIERLFGKFKAEEGQDNTSKNVDILSKLVYTLHNNFSKLALQSKERGTKMDDKVCNPQSSSMINMQDVQDDTKPKVSHYTVQSSTGKKGGFQKNTKEGGVQKNCQCITF